MQLSQLTAATMQYPLSERIGDPSLFVGRVHELQDFHKWVDLIARRLASSRALLARRKSGKTVFVQRLFNQLWSANGQVIPIYFRKGCALPKSIPGQDNFVGFSVPGRLYR